jgi:hypothetical protein
MSSPSISDIVNAKIIELLLECCRKTVIECSNHYGFSSEEALGKMGLLTDYSSLFEQKMCVNSDENVSVSDVSVKTPILNEKKVSKPRTKKAEGENKPRGKKEKKEVVVVETPKEDVKEEVKDVLKEEVKEVVKEEAKKKVSKPRVKKEKVETPKEEVKEEVTSEVKEEVKEEVKKKVSKPRAKKEKKEGDEESKSSETKKGRPKKDKKETEAVSPIDDLFANLVAKEEEAPQVDVVNKMEFQGTTYLKSKNTGIIYNMDQDVVGKWNENTKTIDFDEEEEEEYEDE